MRFCSYANIPVLRSAFANKFTNVSKVGIYVNYSYVSKFAHVNGAIVGIYPSDKGVWGKILFVGQIITINVLKMLVWFYKEVMHPKDADRIANSVEEQSDLGLLLHLKL